MVGHDIFNFLDVSKHQIAMTKEDQEKTSFITNEDTYSYVNMPFRLKNAGAI